MPLHLRSLSNSKAVTRNKKSCLGKKYLNPLHPSKTTTPNRFSSKQPFHPRGNVRPRRSYTMCVATRTRGRGRGRTRAAAELGLPGFTSTILERPCVKNLQFRQSEGSPPARPPGSREGSAHGSMAASRASNARVRPSAVAAGLRLRRFSGSDRHSLPPLSLLEMLGKKVCQYLQKSKIKHRCHSIADFL